MRRTGGPERKTRLRRTGGPSRSGRLNPVSDKRAEENRVRREETRPAVMERSGGRCEIGLPDICTGTAVDMHEVLTRARGGSITDPDNILAACRPCHDHVTENPEWAAEEGYVRWSWDGE